MHEGHEELNSFVKQVHILLSKSLYGLVDEGSVAGNGIGCEFASSQPSFQTSKDSLPNLCIGGYLNDELSVYQQTI